MLDRYCYPTKQPHFPLSFKKRASRDEFEANRGELRALNCLICDHDHFNEIGQVDRYGFYYPTGICQVCGNVQHIKYYNEQSLILFYSNVFRDIYGRQTPAEIFEGQVERGHQLVWFCTDYLKEDAAVLEIGTGCGGILKAFQEKGCRVTGVDFDPRFIEYGQKQGLDVRKGDISAVDSAEKFDLIIISHVLEYIVEPVPFLQKAMDHLAVGGQIYIEVPSLDHVAEGGYNYDLLNYYQNAHVIHFSVATLTTLLHKVGLKILKNDNFICCLVSKSEEEVKDIEANFSDMRKKQIRLIDSIEKKRTSLLGRVCRKIKNKFMS